MRMALPQENKIKPQKRTSLRALYRRFYRNNKGVTAIEFAVLAGPFFLLTLAIIEVAMVFFGTIMLEHGTEFAARLIRTGQAQEAGFSESEFKTQVCSKVASVFNCAAGLKVDVQTFPDFNSIDLNNMNPLDGNGELRNDFSFDMGNASSIVLVRTFFEWDLMAKLPALGLTNMGTGNRLIAAAAAFKNEPYN